VKQVTLGTKVIPKIDCLLPNLIIFES
jgi:hypothetical protein